MRRAAFAPGVATVAFAAFSPGDARAEIAWQAPASCPNADVVRARFRAQAPPDAEEPKADVVVTKTTTFAAELHVFPARGEPSTRRFESDDCEDIADAAALILALVARDEAARADASPDVPTSQAPPPRPLAAARPTRNELGRTNDSGAAPHLELHASLGVGGAVNVLPSAAPGAELTIGASFAAWRIEAGGIWLPAQRTHVTARAGGDFDFLSASARACFVPAFGRWRAGICGGGALHVTSGRAFGVPMVEESTRSDAAMQAALLGDWSFTELFGLRASVYVDAPLKRPRYVIEHLGPVFETPAVGISAFLGTTLMFR